MATCRSCKQEIPDGAIKCSLCQSYQIWYRNPIILNLLFVIPIISFSFIPIWRLQFGGKDFEDYRDQFTVEQIATPGTSDRHLTFEITNNTDYKWEDVSYEIVMKKGARLLSVEHDQEYAWIVRPHSKARVSAYLTNPPGEADTFELNITDMKTSRY